MIALGVLALLAASALPQPVRAQLGERKVMITETSFDSTIESIKWAGHDRRTVLLRTLKKRLYRSDNAGKDWTEITSHLIGDEESGGASMLVDSVVVSSVQPSIVLVVGSHHTHFISEDAARTFRRLKQRTPIHSWVFHPKRPTWALLSTWPDSCKEKRGQAITLVTGDASPCVHMLYVTKDLGRTFELVTAYVVQFSWGDVKSGHFDRIYVTSWRHKHGDQPKFSAWSHDVHFSHTENFGKSMHRLVHGGNKFLVSNGYIFVAVVDDIEKQTVKMMVSNDGAKTFHQAAMSLELQERSYTILDTSSGVVMIHANHGDQAERTGTGNVYVSDAAGLRYSLTLANNVRNRAGECEFDRIRSLDGVYIANFKDDPNNAGKLPNESRKEQEDASYEEEEDEATETQVDRRRGPDARAKSEDVVRTAISFDKGSAWRYLVAPTVDSRGQKIDCPPDRCWLHLHGVTNHHKYAPFYAVDSAVGLIIGTGNIGPHLRFEQDDVNTYLSRDGGQTWVEAHKGSYIYEFGDHGGLIVMADDIKYTKQVVFSWNEGQSWYDFDLGQYPLEVDNIVIEPNMTSMEFLLYGSRADTGVLYYLDFKALGQPQCSGVWAADSVSSDYETWTPTDGRRNDRCVLGRQITYTRRKQTSECFNGRDFDRPVERKACACTQEDFQCEMGFTRRVGSMECVPDDPKLTTANCTSGGIFYGSAYRKIPGDICEGGWVPPPVAVPCPHTSPFGKGAYLVLLVLLVLAILLAISTWLSRHPQYGSIFSRYGFDPFAHIKYTVIRSSKRPGATQMDGFGDDDTDLSFIGDSAIRGGATNRSPGGDKNFSPTRRGASVGWRGGGGEDNKSAAEDEVRDLLCMEGGEAPGARAYSRRAGLAAANEMVPRLPPPPTGSQPLTEMDSNSNLL